MTVGGHIKFEKPKPDDSNPKVAAKLDGMMDEANKAYEKNDLSRAKAISYAAAP